MNSKSFIFEYQPSVVHHGSRAVADIESELKRRDLSRALVVTDSNLGSVSEVMDPVRAGIGGALVGIFDEVTPEKYLKSAYDGANRIRDEDIDALVALGGGSSLDIAKQISVLAGHQQPLDSVVNDILKREKMILPDEHEQLIDIFAVPTTLPGADLSQVAGVQLSMEPDDTVKSEIPSDGISDPRLMPTAVFHDIQLFETTPKRILARSAMNGFDKGIEVLYTYPTPFTDGTAMRGIRLLRSGLPALVRDSTSKDEMSQILQGIALVQYGLSTPDSYRASVIHSFGHAISRNYPVQQGTAHAIAAPHALAYLFEHAEGRRTLLAEALDVQSDAADGDATASAVVDAVADTRDALRLSSRLRSIDEADRDHFPMLARAVVEDPFMDAAPAGLDAEQEDIEAVFEEMW